MVAGLVGACVRPSSALAASGEVSVVGNQLERDGVAWLPRGVQIVGVVAPDGALSGKYVDAHAHFGIDELKRAAASGADTVRLQVSQFGLDPADPLFSTSYVQEVSSAVQSARALGLNVIVSVQAEAPAGRIGRCLLPDAGTERVWSELASVFGGDRGVMFELYNEPGSRPTPTGWQAWANGGPVAQGNGVTCQTVGMQTLINTIRQAGADNVIIVPGAMGERTLAGMPALSDPANPGAPQLAYGVHYPALAHGTGEWDRQFGAASAHVPVIVTEWQASATSPNCNPRMPTEGALLLAYLETRQIGVVGFAFDLPGTIVRDWTYAPTTYDGFACGVIGGGPGQLLFSEFAAQATTATTAQPRSTTAWIISGPALQQLPSFDPSLVDHFFDTPRTFVAAPGASGTAEAPAALPAAYFTNEKALAQAVIRNSLPPGIRAVVYDDEAWRFTPRDQRLHPGRFYQHAAAVAHRHGLLLIAAPGVDLATALAPRTPARREYARFIALHIAAQAGSHADVLEVPSQELELRPAAYAAFVQGAVKQATRARPGLEVVAGISAQAAGRLQPADLLLRAVASSRTLVAGYWIDASGQSGRTGRSGPPGPSDPCGSCTQVMAGFLGELRGYGG